MQTCNKETIFGNSYFSCSKNISRKKIIYIVVYKDSVSIVRFTGKVIKNGKELGGYFFVILKLLEKVKVNKSVYIASRTYRFC